MNHDVLLILSMIVVVAMGAQWLSWWLGLPSILLLLLGGIVVGPILGWLDTDAVFGELLLPGVSLAVAIILYEGGLSLRLSELPKVKSVVSSLVSVGALITWAVGSCAAYFIFDLDTRLSILLGAILVVTGPTVIGPLLQNIRPAGSVGPILKWEGIVIDPLGAMLTVLIFEAVTIGAAAEVSVHVATVIAKTVVLGTVLGYVSAKLLVTLINRHWVAHYLENAVSLMLVVAAFTLSNHFQHESGLWAVTVMGFVLANQKNTDIAHIVEFKENLRTLLISALFVILAARLEFASLTGLAFKGILFVGILMLVARPASVFVSTLRSKLSIQEKWFLSAVAPRGIVAASISSIFALRLEDRGLQGAELLVPITFMTIITTVGLSGVIAGPLARLLRIAEAKPQGLLFVGAPAWVRAVSALLKEHGFHVFLVDTNRDDVREARMSGLPALCSSILAENVLDRIELGGIGRLLAVTPNEWGNALVVQRLNRLFGREACYELSFQQDEAETQKHRYLHAKLLFGKQYTARELALRMAMGYRPKATPLTKEFDFEGFKQKYGERAIPMFIIDANQRLRIITAEEPPTPQPGQTLISLVKEEEGVRARSHHEQAADG